MLAELKHILSKYDDPDRKGFEYYEVASDIGSLPQEMLRTDEGQAELWAFIDAFESSIVLNEDQKPIFERGIKAYFEEDYMVACHLLIPQFESAIRMLVARLGGEILQHDQNPVEGNRYISLDGLLDSDVMKAIFPEDILVYYKSLFTDHNGWNLRNTSCHGLLKADSYNSTMADRIVHAFMVLSQVRVRLPEEG